MSGAAKRHRSNRGCTVVERVARVQSTGTIDARARAGPANSLCLGSGEKAPWESTGLDGDPLAKGCKDSPFDPRYPEDRWRVFSPRKRKAHEFIDCTFEAIVFSFDSSL